jgi:hypothetical protein
MLSRCYSLRARPGATPSLDLQHLVVLREQQLIVQLAGAPQRMLIGEFAAVELERLTGGQRPANLLQSQYRAQAFLQVKGGF